MLFKGNDAQAVRDFIQNGGTDVEIDFQALNLTLVNENVTLLSEGIASNLSITSLRLTNMGTLSQNTVRVLFDGFVENTSLLHLELIGCKVRPNDDILRVFKEDSSLQTFHFEGEFCGLFDNMGWHRNHPYPLSEFGNKLLTNLALTSLQLCGNFVTDVLIQLICPALENSSLTTLQLENYRAQIRHPGYPVFSPIGLIALTEVLAKNSVLKSFIVGGNFTSNDEIVLLACFRGGSVLIEVKMYDANRHEIETNLVQSVLNKNDELVTLQYLVNEITLSTGSMQNELVENVLRMEMLQSQLETITSAKTELEDLVVTRNKEIKSLQTKLQISRSANNSLKKDLEERNTIQQALLENDDPLLSFGTICTHLSFVRENRSTNMAGFQVNETWDVSCGVVARFLKWNCDKDLKKFMNQVKALDVKEQQLKKLLISLKESTRDIKDRDACRIELLEYLREVSSSSFAQNLKAANISVQSFLNEIKRTVWNKSKTLVKHLEFTALIEICRQFCTENQNWMERHNGKALQVETDSVLRILSDAANKESHSLKLVFDSENISHNAKHDILRLKSALIRERNFISFDDPESDKPVISVVLEQISSYCNAMLDGLKKCKSRTYEFQKKLQYHAAGEVCYDIRRLTEMMDELYEAEDAWTDLNADYDKAQRKYRRDPTSENEAIQRDLKTKLQLISNKDLDRRVAIERKHVIRHTVLHYPELLLDIEWRRNVGILNADSVKTDLMEKGILLLNTKFEDFETELVVAGRAVYKTADNLQVIKRFQLLDETEANHFLRQSLLLHKLSPCPFLISINGVFLDQFHGHIIMPYYSLGNLKDYVKAAKVGIETRKKLLIDVMHGLVYLHGQGHVHGDLKPENVFISERGHAVIGDFDGARPADTTVSSLPSTAKYLAPEVIQGSIITCAADMYAFGVMIGEISRDDKELMHHSKQMIHKNSKKRPQADHILHQLGASIRMVPKKCEICYDLFSEDCGILCDEGHFSCKSCTEGYLKCKAEQLQNSYFAKHHNRMINCIVDEFQCTSAPVALNKLRIDTDVKELCIQSIEKYKESCTISKMETDFDARLILVKDEMHKLGMQELKVIKHCDYITSKILELKCPRCGQAFRDFDGCFALKCSRQSCACSFCALCLADCGTDAHSHVARCTKYGGNRGGYYGSLEQFDNAHRIRRGDLLKDYWENYVVLETDEIIDSVRAFVKPLADGISNWIP